MSGLSSEQVQAYHQEGFLSGIPVMSEREIRSYRAAFDGLESKEGQETAQNKLFDRHFDVEFIWQIATHPRILECVAAILGPDVLLLSTHCFCKYGPADKFVAWHQDLRYWGLEPPVSLTAWYAIDDSDRDNGCMRVIPRLHKEALLEHGRSAREGNLLSINQEVQVTEEEEQQAVDCILKAGEMSLHDGMLIHGSLPNRSTRRRCGLAVRYIPTHVSPLAAGPIGTDWKWRPILVSGADNERHFELQAPPFPLN